MVPSLSAVYPLSRLLDITANLKFFRMILILICSLTAWSGKWKLGLNADKCKMMHIGHDLPTKYSMTINGTVWDLDKYKEERDLGVLVIIDLIPSHQCAMLPQKPGQYWNGSKETLAILPKMNSVFST